MFFLPPELYSRSQKRDAFRNVILHSGLTIPEAIKKVLEATWEVEEIIAQISQDLFDQGLAHYVRPCNRCHLKGITRQKTE